MKTMWMPRETTQPVSDRDGLQVIWVKEAQQLYFSGWYDSFTAIEGDSMTLLGFFNALGITEDDCRKAWKGYTKK